MEKFGVGDLIEIDWVDSYSIEGWISKDTDIGVNEEHPHSCTTVGYVLVDRKKWITTTASTSNGGNIHGCLSIPKVAVTQVRVLKKNKKV